MPFKAVPPFFADTKTMSVKGQDWYCNHSLFVTPVSLMLKEPLDDVTLTSNDKFMMLFRFSWNNFQLGISEMAKKRHCLPVTETRYTNPSETSAMRFILSCGVVGVTNWVRSRPAFRVAVCITLVSSKHRSGTRMPAA